MQGAAPRSTGCRARHRGRALPQAVIAAVHGYCIGGGVDLIAACDIRLASAAWSSRCARRRWLLSPTSAACSGCRRSSAPGTWPSSPSRARTSRGARQGDRPRQRRGRRRRGRPRRRRTLCGRDRRQLAHRRPGHQGHARRQRRPHRGRGLDYVATWNAGMLASDDLIEAMTAFMEKRTPISPGAGPRDRPTAPRRRPGGAFSACGATSGSRRGPCGRPRPAPRRARPAPRRSRCPRPS